MYYDRQIKYLDYMENGDKVRSAGFVKIEIRDSSCAIQLNVHGLYPTDTFEREVWIRGGGKECVLGEIKLVNGMGQTKWKQLDVRRLGRDRITMDELDRVQISISKNRELVCQWQNKMEEKNGITGSLCADSRNERNQPSREMKAAEADSPRTDRTSLEQLTMEMADARSVQILEENIQSARENDWQDSEIPASVNTGTEFFINLMSEGTQVWNPNVQSDVNIQSEYPARSLSNEDRFIQNTSEQSERIAPRPCQEQTGRGVIQFESQEQTERGANQPESQEQTERGANQPESQEQTGRGVIQPESQEQIIRGENLSGYQEQIVRNENQSRLDWSDEEGWNEKREIDKTAMYSESSGNGEEEEHLSSGCYRGADTGNDRSSVKNSGFTDDVYGYQNLMKEKKPEEPAPSRPESKVSQNNPALPPRIYEDKWKQLSDIYPHISPFHDERDYLSIGPGDFVILRQNSYKLVSNSFLLHGFYNYGHLILTRIEKKGETFYYIGVPGNFYEREKQVAVMFGFESFECKSEPAQTGDYGYYMIRAEI